MEGRSGEEGAGKKILLLGWLVRWRVEARRVGYKLLAWAERERGSLLEIEVVAFLKALFLLPGSRDEGNLGEDIGC